MVELLLGDEAVGLGALHSGIAGAFSYPGTPATEIQEYIQRQTAEGNGAAFKWSANEKVAYEEALGMSFAGKRALVAMKHVGLNVAADPFMSSALTGAHGGLVLAVADDPGMHSSQNEQDSRYYGQFAKVPVFEPSNQQEAYDMTRQAFELSESFRLPTMVRLVTRLAHSRANVQPREPADPQPLGKATDWRKWTLLPVNARQRFRRLLEFQSALLDYAEHSPYNALSLKSKTGIIASGLAHNYVREVIGDDHSYSLCKLCVYPLPVDMLRRLVEHCDDIYVFEEGYPFIESQLSGLLGLPGKRVHGKLGGEVSLDGELSAEKVRAGLGMVRLDSHAPVADLPGRPPQLCAGCPHCDSYKAIGEALEPHEEPLHLGDIGCYALAALPPYNAIETCVDMGSSIAMALGAAKAGAHPVVCSIGDSTFVHSGMTPLIGAAQIDANMTVFILDNSTVAMTGGQEAFAGGEELVRIVKGLGTNPDHVHLVEPVPKKHAENLALVQREIEHRGLSVIIACRSCVQIQRKVVAEKKATQVAAAS